MQMYSFHIKFNLLILITYHCQIYIFNIEIYVVI